MCYGNEIAEGSEEILKKGIATLKVDGTNGFVFEFPDEVKIAYYFFFFNFDFC